METPLIPEEQTPSNLIAESDEERRQQQVTTQRIEATRHEVEAAQNDKLQTTLF